MAAARIAEKFPKVDFAHLPESDDVCIPCYDRPSGMCTNNDGMVKSLKNYRKTVQVRDTADFINPRFFINLSEKKSSPCS